MSNKYRDYDDLQTTANSFKRVKLERDSHKNHWHYLSPHKIFKKMQREMEELYDELYFPSGEEKKIDPVKAKFEFADVGNFADMGIDNCNRME